MRHIVDAVQVLVAVCVPEPAALSAHHVQRALVDERCVGTDVGAPLCQHSVIAHVPPLRMLRFEIDVDLAELHC